MGRRELLYDAFEQLRQAVECGWRYSIGLTANGDMHRVVLWRDEPGQPLRNVKLRIVHGERIEKQGANVANAILSTCNAAAQLEIADD